MEKHGRMMEALQMIYFLKICSENYYILRCQNPLYMFMFFMLLKIGHILLNLWHQAKFLRVFF